MCCLTVKLLCNRYGPTPFMILLELRNMEVRHKSSRQHITNKCIAKPKYELKPSALDLILNNIVRSDRKTLVQMASWPVLVVKVSFKSSGRPSTRIYI